MQDVAVIGISKGRGACCDCSQRCLAWPVTSCLSCHSEMRGCDVKRDPLNTNATTQKQQFKVPSFPTRETAWLVMTLIYCQIYFFFFWNYSQRGFCLNPFDWIDDGITSYLGGNKRYEKKKAPSNVKFCPYDLFTLMAMGQINSRCNFMDFWISSNREVDCIKQLTGISGGVILGQL